VINRKLSTGILRQKLKSDFRFALADHEMHNDKTFEHDCPCRVTQAICQGSEYLRDARLTGMSGYEDVLNIFGLGRGKLDRSQLA
jgi:hypothetical protein